MIILYNIIHERYCIILCYLIIFILLLIIQILIYNVAFETHIIYIYVFHYCDLFPIQTYTIVIAKLLIIYDSKVLHHCKLFLSSLLSFLLRLLVLLSHVIKLVVFLPN